MLKESGGILVGWSGGRARGPVENCERVVHIRFRDSCTAIIGSVPLLRVRVSVEVPSLSEHTVRPPLELVVGLSWISLFRLKGQQTRPLGAAETATGVVRITPLAVDMKAVIIANGMIVRHRAYISLLIVNVIIFHYLQYPCGQ